MTAIGESMPACVETIPHAATELTALHRNLGAQAVELTQAYLAERLAGDEGITWRRGTALISDRVAILDPVIRVGHDVELAAHFLPLNERAARFRLTDTGSASSNSFTVERRNPQNTVAEKYWIIGQEILSVMRSAGGVDYMPVDPEDRTAFARLTRLIDDIRPYETLAEQ